METLERQHATLSSGVLKILFPEECTAEDTDGDANATAEQADQAEITQEDLQRLYKSFSDGISDERSTEQEQDEAACSDEPSESEFLTTRSQRKRLRHRKLKEAMTQLQAQRAGRFVGPLLEERLPTELPEQPPKRDDSTSFKEADTKQAASTASDGTTNLSKTKRRKLAKRLKRASSSEKDCRGFTAEEIDGHLIIKPC